MYVLLLFKHMLFKMQIFTDKNANSHIIDIEIMAIVILSHLFHWLILNVYFLFYRKF